MVVKKHGNCGRKFTKEHKKHISQSKVGKNNGLIGKLHPMYGKHHSRKTITKMSYVKLGKKNSFYGKHHTESSKLKLSIAHKGKHLSIEHRKKLSIINSGKNHPFYGTHRSKETKRKLSISHKGKNNYFYGKHHTKAFKLKMSKSRKLDKHPMWQGGISKEPYNILFNNDFKEIIKKKNGTKCMFCPKQGDRPHHINYMKFHSSINNCVWVCNSCNWIFNNDRELFFAYWCHILGIEPWENIQEADKYRRLKVVHMMKMVKEKKY